MVENNLFFGVNESESLSDLPINWVSDRQQAGEYYFVITPRDLLYISPFGQLSALDLLSKVNPVLEKVFIRKGLAISEVIDATCGYSLDSLYFLKKGMSVTAFENNPFALVFIRYFEQQYPETYKKFSLNPLCFSKNSNLKTQCLYLDPIFDDKKKRQSRLSMSLLQHYQERTAQDSLSLLKEGIKKVRSDTIIVKASKRQKPLLKGFVSSHVQSKSVSYWRFYTNYQEITDDNFFID